MDETIAHTVMGVFGAFGAKKNLIKVRLTKINEVEGSVVKIPIGLTVEGYLVSEVRVGLSFNIKHALIIKGNSKFKNISKGDKYDLYCTSIIQKILSDNTFETKNSIYKWDLL